MSSERWQLGDVCVVSLLQKVNVKYVLRSSGSRVRELMEEILDILWSLVVRPFGIFDVERLQGLDVAATGQVDSEFGFVAGTKRMARGSAILLSQGMLQAQ